MQNEEPFEIVLEDHGRNSSCDRQVTAGSGGNTVLTQAEDQYDAFRGAFRGTVFSSRGRPVAFLVPTSMAEEARLLLQEGELPEEAI